MLVLTLLMLLPATPATVARAATSPSIDQYVESVPTSRGDRTPQTQPGRGRDLPDDVQRQIRDEGGSDAGKLAAVASSPALGAPSAGSSGDAGGSETGKRGGGDRDRSGGGPGDGVRGGGGSSGAERPSALTAAAGAPSHGDGTAFGWLIGGLLVITGVAAGAALARRRSGDA